MMPFLGGSQREWAEVIEQLTKNYRYITVDLPGFGEAAAVPGYSVTAMCEAVVETLSSLELDQYVLVGHSMAGKVSAVIVRRLRSGSKALNSPAGLILVAPSPPGPEPMSDAKRHEMLESFSASDLKAAQYRQAAKKYVNDNLTQTLPQYVFDRTVDDVLLMNRDAWAAWLTGGSKEDFAEFVGVLDVPTLVIAGAHDASLGAEAQQMHTLPHFSQGELAIVDSSHLIPLEQPAELATIISKFMQAL